MQGGRRTAPVQWLQDAGLIVTVTAVVAVLLDGAAPVFKLATAALVVVGMAVVGLLLCAVLLVPALAFGCALDRALQRVGFRLPDPGQLRRRLVAVVPLPAYLLPVEFSEGA